MEIGKNSQTEKEIVIDLNNLIATRLLIQANSGGGKSYLIRKLLEESHGQVQHIVLDLEGEFSTLREKYDYLLCGRDGDIPVNIKTAALLGKKVLELNVSTIVDISELKKHERTLFVKRFLDSLLDAPRKLWHPVLVVVDEAHQFCPQASKSDSASSVIDLMTRGRKRGYCGVLATQRISKLHKDACAEANNRLIGRTGLDVDRKRASEELGFTSKQDERSLRDLAPGEFYAFGSAISKEIIRVKVGDVKTSHPELGHNLIESSSTPENIKKLLKDVIDLPKEVDEELRTKQDLQNKISELKRENRLLQNSKPKPEIDEKSIERAKDQGYKLGLNQSIDEKNKLIKNYNQVEKKLKDIGKIIGQEIVFYKPEHTKQSYVREVRIKRFETPTPVSMQRKEPIVSDGEYNLGLCEKKLYNLLYQYPDRTFSKAQIGVFTGYSHKSGGFNNAISRLRQLGLIEGSGNNLQAKELVSDLAQGYDFSKEAIIGKLSKCEREIYEVLLERQDEEFSKEELAMSTQTQYSFNSGGFNNAISRLNTLALIERSNGTIKLNPELLEI